MLVQAISPFPTMFSTLSKTEIITFVTFNLSSANAFNLIWSKLFLCGNELRGIAVSEQWSFKADGLLIQVVANIGLTYQLDDTDTESPQSFNSFLTDDHTRRFVDSVDQDQTAKNVLSDR